MMRRREFITLIGGAAVGWPLAARAGADAGDRLPAWRIERFRPAPQLDGFLRSLKDGNFVDGENLTRDLAQ